MKISASLLLLALAPLLPFDAATPAESLEVRWTTDVHTPYLDFSNDATSDFDARLMLLDDDRLSVSGANFELANSNFNIYNGTMRLYNASPVYYAEFARYQTGPNVNNVGLLFRTEKGGTAGASVMLDAMMISHDGNVGIGTTAPDAKLAVKGIIHAQEVKVDLTGSVAPPDYVFENSYKLLPLTQLDTYVQKNKHLPEVPSASEMEKNGINLKEMNLVLLKKVEELTLYVIQQQQEIDALKSKVK
ncbi:hypothetical protein SAMN04488109_3194 [Chryseolinea serpens]|uniref:Uncharacterized protein n=1 Tax=Chryseolinea serpens TaxID=947013 RepID=A0A1M5R4V8_9BACT|nr:tail fiber protein [Chryseolinea serpens]SHH21362.1 hypothetical protein SAMN04488109_3194 [Chryseolinea serpens]